MAKENNRASSGKLVGVALIVVSLFVFFGNGIYPRVDPQGGTNALAPSFAELAHHADALRWYASHLSLLVFPPFLVWAALFVYRRLVERGEKLLALPGVILMVTFAIFLGFELVLDTFLMHYLSTKYVMAAEGAKAIHLALFQYNIMIVLVMTTVAFICLGFGIILYAASMLRVNLYKRWFAWSGILLAGLGLAGYFMGLFHWLWVEHPSFPAYASLLSIWILIMGIFIYRDREA